jgi:signal transduction histidine kinase
LECLQNVAQYADATSVQVTIHQEASAVRFVVHDDGRGFDPQVTGRGSGLQGIADRLGALEGSLEVESAPGHGATLSGRVPVRVQESHEVAREVADVHA